MTAMELQSLTLDVLKSCQVNLQQTLSNMKFQK